MTSNPIEARGEDVATPVIELFLEVYACVHCVRPLKSVLMTGDLYDGGP